MGEWAGIALALRRPDDDALRSRVPTYIHPLAGRALAWHGLSAMAALEPTPRRLLLAAAAALDPSVVRDLPAEIVEAAPDAGLAPLIESLDPAIERILLVDAAAATLAGSLAALVEGPPGVALRGGDGAALAAWLDREAVACCPLTGGSLDRLADGLRAAPLIDPDEDGIVRDRRGLARAGAILRDRLVRAQMDAGATFLLPESVLIDVDVRIGPDTVIYPGVVLEGSTSIGAETVIGPGCRIIDSRIGNGVELKGWNYIVGANIRNRAVLEPHVRRGFD